MEKRVIVFLVLSLAIIFGYEYVLKELGVLPQLPATSEPTAPSSSQSPPPSVVGSANESSSIPASEASSVKSVGEDAQPRGLEGGPMAAETVEVETNLYRAKFTTRGAVLTSWELKRYRESSDEQSAIQLVRQDGKFPGPLAVTTDDTVLAKELVEGFYKVEKDFTTLTRAGRDGHMTFYYENAEKGVRLEKRLTFHADSYVVDIAVKESGLDGSVNVVLGTNFGIVEWGDGFIGLIGPASLVDGKIEKETPDSESERKGTVQWAALQDKYFLSVLIPQQGSSVLVKKEGDKLVSSGVRMPVIASGTTLGLQLYAGPKEFDTIRSLQIGLEDTIDFGWFIYGSWSAVRAVAMPLFYVLRFINDYTHNYGLTIILLTIFIKMLFIPLQYKSYKSMKQMKVIQPKVLVIQEKFKDDRDRLNKELMKLYRDHKANPVGGCLPMLLQMPVFISLFNILYMTIDLRQAPLGLWISDLSVQDPYYVLPIIMGLSMMIQQKITPTTMDPTQAKMMLMLPAFMTILFINFPAGLVLYWLTNNTLTIVQQIVTDRFFSPDLPVPSATDKEAGTK
jgi:YidC/Oxa1 family membrane protein insertase